MINTYASRIEHGDGQIFELIKLDVIIRQMSKKYFSCSYAHDQCSKFRVHNFTFQNSSRLIEDT